MEGVSMYLTEVENRSLLTTLGTRLAPTELVFDALNRRAAKKSKQHDTVSKTAAEFRSGIDSAQEVTAWGAGIALKDEIYALAQFADYPARLPLWARYIRSLLVPIFKKSFRILHLQLTRTYPSLRCFGSDAPRSTSRSRSI